MHLHIHILNIFSNKRPTRKVVSDQIRFDKIINAALTCRRCGISPPTLRKWLIRYEEYGLKDLEPRSRRPLNNPNKKLTTEIIKLITNMRLEGNIGNRRIQEELIRHHNIRLSRATIHIVLSKHL